MQKGVHLRTLGTPAAATAQTNSGMPALIFWRERLHSPDFIGGTPTVGNGGNGPGPLGGHSASVRCLDVCGSRVVSGSYDCTCRVSISPSFYCVLL